MTEIFVFGSNLRGRHGKGSALEALLYHEAIEGQAIGLQGKAYGIPTKDAKLKTLSLNFIGEFVKGFLQEASLHPEHTYKVVAIGCGNAGYTPAQIAPLFRGYPSNVILPDSFLEVLYHDAKKP